MVFASLLRSVPTVALSSNKLSHGLPLNSITSINTQAQKSIKNNIRSHVRLLAALPFPIPQTARLFDIPVEIPCHPNATCSFIHGNTFDSYILQFALNHLSLRPFNHVRNATFPLQSFLHKPHRRRNARPPRRPTASDTRPQPPRSPTHPLFPPVKSSSQIVLIQITMGQHTPTLPLLPPQRHQSGDIGDYASKALAKQGVQLSDASC